MTTTPPHLHDVTLAKSNKADLNVFWRTLRFDKWSRSYEEICLLEGKFHQPSKVRRFNQAKEDTDQKKKSQSENWMLVLTNAVSKTPHDFCDAVLSFLFTFASYEVVLCYGILYLVKQPAKKIVHKNVWSNINFYRHATKQTTRIENKIFLTHTKKMNKLHKRTLLCVPNDVQ